MALRHAFLIVPLLLGLSGCLRAPAQFQTRADCAPCHAPHYVSQGTCHECHRGDPRAGRRELAHQGLLVGGAAEHRLRRGPVVSAGAELVERAACRRCHLIGGAGNRLAADLDHSVWQRSQTQLESAILAPVENMPRFGFERSQAVAVIAYLLSRGDARAPLEAYRVSFSGSRRGRDDVFEEKCRGCHRVLGPLGPLGAGSQAPNLSGLFTRVYPPTAPGERPWTSQAIAQWLANPRKARPATTMPPVPLSERELARVIAQLGGAPASAAGS